MLHIEKSCSADVGEKIRDESTWLGWPELSNGYNFLFNDLQEIYILSFNLGNP